MQAIGNIHAKAYLTQGKSCNYPLNKSHSALKNNKNLAPAGDQTPVR
jgi:hypothetical protein